MCGIAGLLGQGSSGAALAPAILHSMTDAIRARGPDAEGHWRDDAAAVALGHRRLAIIDLSDAGAQPMQSACGRFVIVFNGEIYNHLDLRKTLVAEGRAPEWHGHSDTETLLGAIAAWGLVPALQRAFGMFALALWDRKDQTLTLARDRMGEKPLYWAEWNGHWAFASQPSALRALPGFAPGLSRAGVAAYLARGYVDAQASLMQGLMRVAPGGMVSLRAGRAPEQVTWQDFGALAGGAALQTPPPDSASARRGWLEDLLAEVVAQQQISDVPLGCFLSGGIDSSLVAALMQAGSGQQVQSFSIGFSGSRFDESPYAEAVARHLGCAHQTLHVTEEDALALVPELPRIYDEPFADSSQIPTTLLCRQARAHVTVALTGDGADEVFGGYNRHVLGPGLWRNLSRLPRPVRRALGKAVMSVVARGGASSDRLQALARRFRLPVTLVDKLARLGRMSAEAGTPDQFYAFLTRGIADPAALMVRDPGAVFEPSLPGQLADLAPGSAEWLMARDSIGYLPDDILVKVDRAAMAVSLETRTPYLDGRVVSAAWALDQSDRIDRAGRARRGKVILRDILARHVPPVLTERPKQGFAIPLDDWLRGGLRSWAERLLARDDLMAEAGLDPTACRSLWSRHIAQQGNEGQALWAVLMLLAWLGHLPAGEV
ncbi:asparagine synthase (glutamine-hydrolyzing) [Roseibaca sp. V10]|uniref:asparagine synthase (glutamine-hydrolyzing) n=1 Tax=Roseinatronobacter domitianus TaxID=2940293 RepID=A0ABT0M2X3_9RHOB|nr:asparagine synthase (glutamine-hydrolyzing) [Roseibaca domitiana]MCL1629207.1 asparagine synthase (glutamine-hydrolyzing) [Roseibaca domitiana]